MVGGLLGGKKLTVNEPPASAMELDFIADRQGLDAAVVVDPLSLIAPCKDEHMNRHDGSSILDGASMTAIAETPQLVSIGPAA